MRVRWQPPPQPMSATQVELLDRLYGIIALVKNGNVGRSIKKARLMLELLEAWDDDEDY